MNLPSIHRTLPFLLTHQNERVTASNPSVPSSAPSCFGRGGCALTAPVPAHITTRFTDSGRAIHL